VDFEVVDRELNSGDIILLCSDGLSNMIPDERILEIVSTRGPDLDAISDALVAEANAQGGRDNISALLVRYGA
jgi:serine/threonine protein phosphatase PrpC